MNVKEYQEMTKKLLRAQGIKLEGDDEFTKTILMAILTLFPLKVNLCLPLKHFDTRYEP
jgi:hypothetical protein